MTDLLQAERLADSISRALFLRLHDYDGIMLSDHHAIELMKCLRAFAGTELLDHAKRMERDRAELVEALESLKDAACIVLRSNKPTMGDDLLHDHVIAARALLARIEKEK